MGAWHIAVQRVVESGGTVAAGVRVSADDATHVCAGWYAVERGLIVRATEYWIELSTESAPEWRAAWTELIDQA